MNGRTRIYGQDWLEHVERTEEGRISKKVLRYRPKGRTDPGRPRKNCNS